MKEIYQILSAAMGQEQRLDIIANNLANADTVGFKQDRATFTELLAAAGDPGAPGAGAARAFPALVNGYIDLSPGGFIETEGTYDVAIEGEGFFEIEGPDPATSYYTRAGNFRLNDQNELTTVDGRRVLDGSGGGLAPGSPITIDTADGPISIRLDGTIMVGESSAGRLQTIRFENSAALTKYGEGLFAAPPEALPAADDTAKIHHGFLEGSNVRPIEEMVRLIETQRAFEAHQRMMQSVDDVIGRRIGMLLNG